jgi:hypothetical protein
MCFISRLLYDPNYRLGQLIIPHLVPFVLIELENFIVVKHTSLFCLNINAKEKSVNVINIFYCLLKIS